MAKCRTCENETGLGKRICYKCLSKWSDMRADAFEFLQSKYGKMSPENHPIITKEMKRLDRLWRKDIDKFYKEIHK
jgi:hypothetical protein